jgi:hypothetical protein
MKLIGIYRVFFDRKMRVEMVKENGEESSKEEGSWGSPMRGKIALCGIVT